MKLRIHQGQKLEPNPLLTPATIELLAGTRYGEPNGDSESEGEALADLLFARLSGATLEAMVSRLRVRYASVRVLRSPFETGEML